MLADRDLVLRYGHSPAPRRRDLPRPAPVGASIGYTLPALVGATLAGGPRRGVLLVGDGAAQMTVQELSTLLRQGLSATVIVLDNRGYTVERAIHGPAASYNDIAEWDWTALPALFAPHRPSTVRRVTTNRQLADALHVADDNPGQLSLSSKPWYPPRTCRTCSPNWREPPPHPTPPRRPNNPAYRTAAAVTTTMSWRCRAYLHNPAAGQ